MKISLLIIVALFSNSSFAADAKKVCNPTVAASISAVKESTEDGKFLVARVTHKGKPLSNIVVAFQTPRLFGILSHGEVETDNDGVAKLVFPENFPGDSKTGDFAVTAKIVKSETYLGESTIKVDGGKNLKEVENPFPREIWSTKTDLHLLLTIPVLILCVWSVYAFSIMQLIKIARMNRKPRLEN